MGKRGVTTNVIHLCRGLRFLPFIITLLLIFRKNDFFYTGNLFRNTEHFRPQIYLRHGPVRLSLCNEFVYELDSFLSKSFIIIYKEHTFQTVCSYFIWAIFIKIFLRTISKFLKHLKKKNPNPPKRPSNVTMTYHQLCRDRMARLCYSLMAGDTSINPINIF